MDYQLRYVRSRTVLRSRNDDCEGSPLLIHHRSVWADRSDVSETQHGACAGTPSRHTQSSPSIQGARGTPTGRRGSVAGSELNDLQAVVDAFGLSAFSLVGRATGVPLAITFAARNHEAVKALILWYGAAHGRALRLSPRAAAVAQLIDIDFDLYLQCLSLVDFGWTETGRIMAGIGSRNISADTLKRAFTESRKSTLPPCEEVHVLL